MQSEERTAQEKARARKREYMRKWRRANPERTRMRVCQKTRYKAREYGLTSEEYANMVSECNGRCPCCKTQLSEIFGTKPCIDHKAGIRNREAVRGIVCTRCNLILGCANDDPRILKACVSHLENTK